MSQNMNEIQKRAIKDLLPQLVNELDVDEVIRYLHNREVLSKGRKQKLDKLVDDRDKCTELVDIITRIDCSWATFLDAISAADQQQLREKLEAKGGKPKPQQNAADQGSNSGGSNSNLTKQTPEMIDFERPIRLTANVHTLKSERESIASKIDPHDAALFMDHKGLAETHVDDITAERNNVRAKKILLDALPLIENGFSLLLDYFNQDEQNKHLANTLKLVHGRYVQKIQEQVAEFLKNRKVLEPDVEKRNELLQILKQKFDVKVEDRYIVERCL